MIDAIILLYHIVNCGWSEWGQWSKCSATCGDNGSAGIRERYRHIAIEAQHGGLPCDADTPKETEECIHCKIRPDSDELEFRKINETYFKENCIPFCPSKNLSLLNLYKCCLNFSSIIIVSLLPITL